MGKIRPDLITPEMEEALAQVLTEGAEKYSARGWEEETDVHTVAKHYESLCRHLLEWKLDNDHIDPETGLNPLKHAFCRLGMIITLLERGHRYGK